VTHNIERQSWERYLDAVGIHHEPTGGWHFSVRPRFFALIGALVFFGALFAGGMAKYSTSPSFCNSCHIMAPYYQAWKTSKHKDVPCVECHYPPGSHQTLLWKKFQAMSQVVKYVTRTYSSKPFAEVEDSACLRVGCHSTRLLEGKLVSKAGVRFDHRPHLSGVRRGRQLRCVSCHSQVMVGKHIEVTYDTCFLCHFKGRGEGSELKPLAGCLGCHPLPAKSFKLGNMTYNHKDFVTKQGVSCNNCHLDSVQGKGDALKERCFTCHNQPEKLARYGDDAFIHENHVTKHNIACFHCHQEIKHGFNQTKAESVEALGAPSGAPAGHPSAQPFECSYCHKGKHSGQLEMYSGVVAGADLPKMPSPMFLAKVACVGCHYDESGRGKDSEFAGFTEKASENACVKCHGLKFTGIWGDTKAELEKTQAEIGAKVEAAKAALDKAELKGAERAALSGKIAEAELQARFVRVSRGEHNIYLASEALRLADKSLSEAGQKTGAALKDLSSLPLISGGYCATMCHGKVGVKVPPETVKAFGKTMPHKSHTEQMGCVQCHDIGGHKKVPLRKDVKAVCAGCHQ